MKKFIMNTHFEGPGEAKLMMCPTTFFNRHIQNGSQKTKVPNKYKNTSIFQKNLRTTCTIGLMFLKQFEHLKIFLNLIIPHRMGF